MSQITVCDACQQPLPVGQENGLQLRMPGDDFDLTVLVIPAGGANVCISCIATKVAVPDEHGPAKDRFLAEAITQEVLDSVFGPVVQAATEAENRRLQGLAQAQREQLPQRQPQRAQQGLQAVARRASPALPAAYVEAMQLNPTAPTEQDLAQMAAVRAQRQSQRRQQAMQMPQPGYDDGTSYDEGYEDDGDLNGAIEQYAQWAHQPPPQRRQGPPPGMSMMGM